LSPLRLLFRGLAARRAPVLLAVIGVAINIFVVGLGLGLRSATAQAIGDPTGAPALVVGPAGSALQLVLCGVLLVEPCRGQLDGKALRAVEASPSARQVVPFATGDSAAGAPVFASLSELFAPGLRSGAGGLQLVEGRAIASTRADLDPLLDGALAIDARFEAVLGASAAARLGLPLGAQLGLQHGAGGGAAHGPAWTIVGRLAPTGTALDEAVIVDLTGFLAMPEHEDQVEGRGVSGAWVAPRGGVHKGLLLARLSADPAIRVADLRSELARLDARFGQADRALGALAALMVLGAALSGGAAQWASLAGRERELALLVVLGAQRRDLSALLMAEGALVCGGGGAIGAGAAALFGRWLQPAAALLLGARLGPGLGAGPAVALMAMMTLIGVLVAIPVARQAAGRAARAALGAAA
jgi:putative ABC transport system permease protein